ncbi:MAG: nickel-dependent hydrogenase large subunit, partial [Peptococcaceae bacterium]|nr:nickel-dependent hydrogenase large subunit [Peptococcaceae bacterium]
MAEKIIIDPITRIEGHMAIDVVVDGGKVIEAKSHGTMFRGMEMILKGRDPRDACHIMQRICGVCPIAHGTASMLCLDDAFGVKPPPNGRIIRNLIQGANFLQSNILHFYHLAALDYVKGPDIHPFVPRYEGDYRLPERINKQAVDNYLEALHIRRKSHEMLAVFGAKMPHVMTFTAGGVTETATTEKIALFRRNLREITGFVNDVYIPDLLAVAEYYDDHYSIGAGCKNMMSYGGLPITDEDDPDGQKQLYKRGLCSQGEYLPLDPAKIVEEVKYSYFNDYEGGRYPTEGLTEPKVGKKGAYSWMKSPRYEGLPYEVGPLARQVVNKRREIVALGDKAYSVLGRLYARALETAEVAGVMDDWLDELRPGEPSFAPFDIPKEGIGMGLHEGPRGALGHWIVIKDYKIDNYQA